MKNSRQCSAFKIARIAQMADPFGRDAIEYGHIVRIALHLGQHPGFAIEIMLAQQFDRIANLMNGQQIRCSLKHIALFNVLQSIRLTAFAPKSMRQNDEIFNVKYQVQCQQRYGCNEYSLK